MKTALIGVGRWGKVLLGELGKLAEVKYRCDSKSDLNKVWSDPEVTAVFIATPTQTHLDIAIKALNANKHVFLEKPGTTNSVNLEKLVKRARAKNLKFAVGYEFPHHPAAKKLKELTAGKEIKSVHCDWQKWGAFKDDAVKHLLCHEVSIAKFLGLELKPLSCQKIRVISDSDIVETVFEPGLRSRINRASPIKQKTVTVMTDSQIYIWSNDSLFEVAGEELAEIALPKTTAVASEISDFLLSDKPLCNGQFALEIYKIIEQV